MDRKTAAHVNGWHTISAWLDSTHKKQKDLAAALDISGPAITQLKRGRFLLNGMQIRRIIEYFSADKSEAANLYKEIVRARFFLDTAIPEELDEEDTFVPVQCPVIQLEDLESFDPIRSSLADFATQNAARRVSPPHGTPHDAVLILLNKTFPPEHRILLADSTKRASHGELAVARGHDGGFSVGLFFSGPEQYGIRCVLPGFANYMSRLKNPPILFHWVYPLRPLTRSEAIKLLNDCQRNS